MRVPARFLPALPLFLVVSLPMLAVKPQLPVRFVKQVFSPKSAVFAAAGAGLGQLRDSPREWGQGAAGFGKRFASGMGKHGVDECIKFGVGRLHDEELSYRSSGKEGFGPRLAYALESTVVTHKKRIGEPTIAAGELSGAFGSGLISRLWQPASLQTVSSGVASGGITLGVDAGTHVVREFWPEITHSHRNRVYIPIAH